MNILKSARIFFAAAALGGAGCSAPNTTYIVFADGVSTPEDLDIPAESGFPGTDAFNLCKNKKGPPPKFVCNYPPEQGECMQQLKGALAPIFADFNMKFTDTPPDDTPFFYTVVLSSGPGDWCGQSELGGIAPSNCDLSFINNQGSVANVFLAGDDPAADAETVAHEMGHMVRLVHTTDSGDSMFYGANLGRRFLNKKMPTDGTTGDKNNDTCGKATQNSWRMMRDALGPP